MSGTGISSILMELETAIKNSYMSEFEEFIKNEEKDTCENPLPSKILDCEDEETLLKAVADLDCEVELRGMLKIEEQVYSNTFEDKEKAFSSLYYLCTNRIVSLVKALQKVVKDESSQEQDKYNSAINREGMILSLQDKIRNLNGRIVSLQEELSVTTVELDDRKEMYSKLSDKYEDLVYELEMFKGNEKVFKKFELPTLLKFEEDLQKSLKIVAKIKNEKIMEYMEDIKSLKQANEDAKKCIICHESQACILLKPCNHANVCEECSLKLTNCPIDRSKILGQERVFL